VLPSLENADPSPDPARLLAAAGASGGTAVELSRWRELIEAFPAGAQRREPMSSTLEDVWDHLGVLLAVLGLLSAEWILRKRSELI